MSPTDQHPPEVVGAVRRAADAVVTPLQRILAIEAASGVVLLAVSGIALVWANIWPTSYSGLWHTPIGIGVGSWSYYQPLHFWVNEGLMTIFFFIVGLEIRREIFEGELKTLRGAALPLAAAIGGMLVPAAIFAALNVGRSGAVGWAIPMATDIAFAVGVLTLLGSRVPASLRALLLSLAVIDDIGAIIVITIFFSSGISLGGFLVLGAGTGLAMVMRAAGVRAPLVYVVPGLIMWSGLLAAGVHPTIAGVMLGLLTPARSWFGISGFAATTRAHLDQLPDADHGNILASLDVVEHARREAVSPVERLIHALHPWVAFGVMPVFALANAGVVLGDASIHGDGAWLFIGIVAGLALGKPAGIAAFALVSARLGWVASSAIAPRGVLLVGLVGGIGFTMSLFVAQLAIPPGPLLDTAKLAILVGSGLAIVLGLVVGYTTMRRPPPSTSTTSSPIPELRAT